MLQLTRFVALVATSLLATGLPAQANEVSANDAALFLAGMTPSAGSPLTALTSEPSWQRHARFFDNAFAELEQRQLSKIRSWASDNLAAPKPTMFYMFSGPDFLYADAFYSKATTYVLSALEPIGSVPDLMRLPQGQIGPSLNQIERSLSSMLSFSFFITKLMKDDLREGQVSGTLPILYVLLARSGKTIRDVSLVALDAQGVVHLADEHSGRNSTQGVRILFAGSDGQQKTLYYFSTDLSNSGFRHSAFLKFCQGLAPGNTLIKSASYLLHEANFGAARNFLLANSATIIQDDSGIPLADYDRNNWRFFPFGRYLGPIAKFPGMYQPEYAELFRQSRPMDFGIGYRWRPNETNLLLSIRVASDSPPQVSANPPAQVARQRPRPPSPPSAFLPWFGIWR